MTKENFKNLLKTVLLRLFKLRLVRVLPRGCSFSYDLEQWLPGYVPQVIFDVGANRGQSAVKFRQDFPRSHIYCFEPVYDTFDQLRTNPHLSSQVTFECLALGESKSVVQMTNSSRSVLNRIVDNPGSELEDNLIEVNVDTVDNYCSSRQISHINYLKIDTEGHDKAVALGAKYMLKSRRIDFLEAELGCGPDNTRHVPLIEFVSFMESQNYVLFGFYEQCHEWPLQRFHLRRCNAVFCSREIVERFPVRLT